jgi:hypothetical protein
LSRWHPVCGQRRAASRLWFHHRGGGRRKGKRREPRRCPRPMNGRDVAETGPSSPARPVSPQRRFQTFLPSPRDGEARPNCDIGRAGSGRPLPDPTADLGTLSVQEQKSGGPDRGRVKTPHRDQNEQSHCSGTWRICIVRPSAALAATGNCAMVGGNQVFTRPRTQRRRSPAHNTQLVSGEDAPMGSTPVFADRPSFV